MKWISTKEKLPQPYEEVWVFPYKHKNPAAQRFGHIDKHGQWFLEDDDGYPIEVSNERITHWMPEPETPHK